jgi:hypothetical protein
LPFRAIVIAASTLTLAIGLSVVLSSRTSHEGCAFEFCSFVPASFHASRFLM